MSPTIPNGIIIRYDLIYTNTSMDCTTGTNVSFSTVPEQTVYDTTLTGLLPYTAYTLCVRASTEAGPGNFSLVTTRTLSSPPTNLEVTFVNSTSVGLAWGYPVTPQGLVQGYIISGPTTVNISIFTNDTGTQNYIFSGLTLYTEYTFSVRAYTYSPDLTGPLYGEYSLLDVRTAEDCE